MKRLLAVFIVLGLLGCASKEEKQCESAYEPWDQVKDTMYKSTLKGMDPVKAYDATDKARAARLEPRDLACESRFMLLLFDGDDQPPLFRDCQLPFEFWRDTLPLRSAYMLFEPLPTRSAFCEPALRCIELGALRSRFAPWL